MKLVALVPPPRSNLVRYFGVFAPGSALRQSVVSAKPSLPSTPARGPVEKTEASVTRSRPTLDWAALLKRTFDIDVFRCPCGGQRLCHRLCGQAFRSPGHPRAYGTALFRTQLAPGEGTSRPLHAPP
jgi:hypothetical protein